MVGSACERLQQTDADRDDAGNDAALLEVPDEDESANLSEEERLSRKLALYIACIDRSRARIETSWARYVDDIDPESGTPRRKGDAQPFLQAIDKELHPCLEAQERGPKLAPALPEIEAAMSVYLETSTRFAEHTRILHHYYETKTYETDEWAQGKALAPEIASAHQAWMAAAKTLVSAVSDKRDEVEGAMLELIEAREGRSLRWHANHLTIEAKKLRTCLEQPDATAKSCEDELAALRGAHQAFRAHHDAHAAEAAKVFWMLAFETTADELVEEATNVMRALPKAKPKARQEAIDGLVRIHEDLASDHANLKFDFP